MADNTIIIGGATQPSTINTPGDKRERVTTFEKIFEIDNPAVGGTVWVEDEQKEISFTLSQLGLAAGEYLITDVWTGEQYPLTDSFTSVIPPHGSRLLAITKVGGLKLYDANVRVNSAEVCGNTMTLVVDYDYKETEFTFSDKPKAITCQGAEIPFTVENGVTKLAVSGKKPIVITF